jgi:formate/nitrite transporter FocA (FNT family)
MAFVASGFEHSIANMYLIPAGLITKGFTPAQLIVMFHNVLPVTLGNIVGGLFIVLIHPNRIRQIVALFPQRKAKLT